MDSSLPGTDPRNQIRRDADGGTEMWWGFLDSSLPSTDPQNQAMRVWPCWIKASAFFLRWGEDGRTNDSGSLDEEICTAEI
jgi:hypothetical protein